MIKLDRRKDELTLVSENPPVNLLLLVGAHLAMLAITVAGGLRFAENPSLQLWLWLGIAVLALWSVTWLVLYKQVLRTTTQFDVRRRRVTITSLLLQPLMQRRRTTGPVEIGFDSIEELRLSTKQGAPSLTLILRDGRKHLLVEEWQRSRTTAGQEELRTAAKLIEEQTGLGLNDTINPPRVAVLT